MTDDPNEYFTETAREMSCLPLSVQKTFLTTLCRLIGDEDVIMDLASVMFSRTGKHERLIRWMEGRFAKNMGLVPVRVAREAVYYLKMNSRMMPFLIKTAQQTKDRIRHRISYKAHKQPLPSLQARRTRDAR